MSKYRVGIVWFRQDLRLSDNPALTLAREECEHLIPVYLHDSQVSSSRKIGGATSWWLHHSLSQLQESLQAKDSRLILRSGDPADLLPKLIAQTGASAVYWNRCYEPSSVERDRRLKKNFRENGIVVRSFNGLLLQEPHRVSNQSGKPFRVFTPFWRHVSALPVDDPLPVPRRPLAPPPGWPTSEKLDDWKLLPKIDWDKGFYDVWEVGEKAAREKLNVFLSGPVTDYREQRNIPAEKGTSRLSPHLHFGEISPRQIWLACHQSKHASTSGAKTFLSEVGWREFAYHLLYHYPQTTTKPLQEKFNSFPWREDRKDLEIWCRGTTGIPMVDAGMRELWSTGWMHNRVRMIVGSFLVKNLLISWREGERWFWDTLVDADLASNTLGWQWVGGCGADAAPYFRVFNPVLQGEKFDPEGDYVKKWIPALKKLPKKYLHQPWTAPPEILKEANIVLGQDYPKPMLDLKETRERALQAFAQIKEA